jgi:hypothetical protein
MLADPAQAARDAAARRQWLEPRFHIDVMQEQVEALYREILDRKAARAAPRSAPVEAEVRGREPRRAS